MIKSGTTFTQERRRNCEDSFIIGMFTVVYDSESYTDLNDSFFQYRSKITDYNLN